MRQLRIEPNGRLLVRHGLVVVALEPIGLAAIAIGHGRIRPQRDGGAEILDRLVDPAGMQEDGTAIVMGIGEDILGLARRGDDPRAGGDHILDGDLGRADRFVAEIGVAGLLLGAGPAP